MQELESLCRAASSPFTTDRRWVAMRFLLYSVKAHAKVFCPVLRKDELLQPRNQNTRKKRIDISRQSTELAPRHGQHRGLTAASADLRCSTACVEPRRSPEEPGAEIDGRVKIGPGWSFAPEYRELRSGF